MAASPTTASSPPRAGMRHETMSGNINIFLAVEPNAVCCTHLLTTNILFEFFYIYAILK
jgi:hypothetical protein